MGNILKQHTYTVNGLNVCVQQSNTQGKKIIALHGWQDNSNSFIPLYNQLSNFNWHLVDFPGHGHSDWRDSQAHYYFVDYVNDVFNIINQISPNEPVIIIGHSMGAMVAHLFSACFPEHVAKLILIEGFGCVTTEESAVVEQLRKAILNRINMKTIRTYDSLNDVIKLRMSFSDLNYENTKLIVSRNCKQTQTGVQLRIDPKIKQHSGFRFSPNQAQQIIKHARSPILLIKGRQGYQMVDNAIQNIDKQNSHIRVETIDGGHHCHMESVNELSQIVNVYVNSDT